MILSCMLFLLRVLPLSDLVKSMLAGVLLLVLLCTLFRIAHCRREGKKSMILRTVLIVALVIDMVRLLPYMDPRERNIPLELAEIVTIENQPVAGRAYSCYYGGGYNRDPEEVAKEICAAGGKSFTPIDPRGYTDIYVWGQKAVSVSYSVWDNLDYFPIPFKPVVYWGTLEYEDTPLSSAVYIYRVSFRPLEIRDFC